MATRKASRHSRHASVKDPGGSKRALLVAINDYGSPQNNLPSCREDAAQFRSVLQSRYGFETFTELYDGDATVANVEGGLTWLFDKAGGDDRLVFFYSGHGYQQPRNGNLEECLVLSNFEFLFDDRLSELSQSVPPGILTVVLDSCFSGGMEKRILIGKGVEVARSKLWIPPAAATPDKSFRGKPLVPRPFGSAAVTGAAAVKRLVLGTHADRKAVEQSGADGGEGGQLQLNGLLLTASSENETASASTSATDGMSAFTHALMRSFPASGEISVARLHEGARARLAEMGFQQTPLLKLPANAAELASSSFVTLTPPTMKTGQPAKTPPAHADGGSLTTPKTKDAIMTDQQAHDQQFWRAVERVAAQVALAAGNQAPAERKSFAPTTRPAVPTPANGQAPTGPTTRPAGQVADAPQAVGGNGAASPVPLPGVPTGEGSTAGQEKWVRVALRVGMAAATAIDLALHARRKDFAAEIAAESGGDEKLAEAVAEAVAPAIVDALVNRQDESGSPDESGDGDDKFPWGSVARVAASAVPAIVAEATGRNEPIPDLAADVAADDQKSALSAAFRVGRRIMRNPTVAAVAGTAVWHAMAAARGKGLNGTDGDDRIARAAARIAAEVVPAIVDQLTGRSEPSGEKMILPPGMQFPRVLPGRYILM